LDNSWCHQFSRTSKGVLQRHCSDAINRHRVAMSSILLSYVLSTLPTQNLIALCTARTSFTRVGNAKHFHHCAVLIAPIFLNAILHTPWACHYTKFLPRSAAFTYAHWWLYTRVRFAGLTCVSMKWSWTTFNTMLNCVQRCVKTQRVFTAVSSGLWNWICFRWNICDTFTLHENSDEISRVKFLFLWCQRISIIPSPDQQFVCIVAK